MKLHQEQIENNGEHMLTHAGIHTHERTKLNARRVTIDPVYYRDGINSIYRYAKRFLEKNIGSSFDKVQHEFIQNATARHFKKRSSSSYQDILLLYIQTVEKEPLGWRWYDYYVDKNGIIRKKNFKSYKARKREEKKVQKNAIAYKFNYDKFGKYSEQIFNILKNEISYDFAWRFMCDTVKADTFDKVATSEKVGGDERYTWGYGYVLTKIHEVVGDLDKFRTTTYNGLYQYATPIYGEDKVVEEKSWRKSAKEHYEKRDADRKKYREIRKQKETQLKELMEEVAAMKRAEKENNTQTIERLGFDEQISFRK